MCALMWRSVKREKTIHIPTLRSSTYSLPLAERSINTLHIDVYSVKWRVHKRPVVGTVCLDNILFLVNGKNIPLHFFNFYSDLWAKSTDLRWLFHAGKNINPKRFIGLDKTIGLYLKGNPPYECM